MVSDGGLIAMSLISLAGMVLLFTMNNSMWFKKQNFKVELFNVKATNKLNLKKLEKEMGLTTSKKSVTEESGGSPLGGIEKLLPLLKNLDPETLSGLVETYTGLTADEGGTDGGMVDTLLGYAEDHPEIVKGLLQGLSGDGEEQVQSQV
jgi:hypothetical protein